MDFASLVFRMASLSCLFFAAAHADASDPPLNAEHHAKAVSLEQAIERALRWHPRDRGVLAEVALAEARVEAARAESLPTLDFRYEHIWEDSHIAPGGVRDPLDLYNVMAISSVPLVHARAWANWSEAKERLELREADALVDRREIALAAAHAWIGAASATHALDVEVEALRTARAHAEFVRGRLASGAAAVLDLVRAEKEVAATSAWVERARAAQIRAQERLGLLTGADGPLDADVSQDQPLPRALEGEDLLVPDVAAARLALEVARNDTRNMFTDYLPSLHLELLGFHQNHPQPILPVTGTGYAAFLRLTVPLYDPEREATLHERQAEELRAEAHLDDVIRIIEVERRDGHSDIVQLKAALDETVRAAELSRQALHLTETRYANGAGTQLDVIYALRESRDADIAVMVAEDAWRRAALELLAARGRLPTQEQLKIHH
jgi:outer membrane protein TolC